MNVVLFEPEIPGNTGNIGRSCVGTDSTLHLVGRLGFSLSDKYLKRSGLDYWKHVTLKTHESWNTFLQTIPNRNLLYFLEKDGPRSFWETQFEPNCYLIFGSESKGFSTEIIENYSDRFIRIPMTGPIRSLNLSSSVAVAMYEVLRQNKR